MSLTYFKRFRMEIDLAGREFPVSPPAGYQFVPWHSDLLDAHAETKWLSFRSELDSNVFPCLGELSGCLRLMNEISRKPGFLPQATWLMAVSGGSSEDEFCGTVQGITDRTGMGAIQNLGILPEHRRRSLGTCLMHKALGGFQRAGLRRAFLEVTAQNESAIELYERMGFHRVRTVYKVVEVAYSGPTW